MELHCDSLAAIDFPYSKFMQKTERKAKMCICENEQELQNRKSEEWGERILTIFF